MKININFLNSVFTVPPGYEESNQIVCDSFTKIRIMSGFSIMA